MAETKRNKGKLKITIGIIVAIFAVIAIIMSMTNPSPNDHLKVIKEYLDKYDMSQLDLTEEEMAQYTNYMSSGVNANFMDKVVKPSFQVQDYGLWSIGSFKNKEVTLGIFNNVILLDNESTGKDLLNRDGDEPESDSKSEPKDSTQVTTPDQ
jgi:hypothetical protein